jgi:adenylosuccinate synthase
MTISEDDIEREKANVKTIASTGQGVGAASARRILDRGVNPVQMAKDVEKLKPYPHVTCRDTTVAGCLSEAGISPSRVRKVVMVCRTYPIRVQNPEEEGMTSGPMSQEISLPEIERRSGISLSKLQKTETTSTTKRRRRISEFDWVLLKKAAELNAPTDVALTFVDYIRVENQDARRFEQLTQDTLRFIQEVERVAEAPVSLISTRFHHRSIIDRRAW